jgi:hypothetical protein
MNSYGRTTTTTTVKQKATAAFGRLTRIALTDRRWTFILLGASCVLQLAGFALMITTRAVS